MPTVLSGSEFMRMLCDQALLSRGIDDGGVALRQGEWPSPEHRTRALERDWEWISALTTAYVEAIVDLWRERKVAMLACNLDVQSPGMRNLVYRTNDKVPAYPEWFAGWAVDHATRALMHSPRFADPVVFHRRGTFQFSRDHRGVWFEHVPVPSEPNSAP